MLWRIFQLKSIGKFKAITRDIYIHDETALIFRLERTCSSPTIFNSWFQKIVVGVSHKSEEKSLFLCFY